MPAGPALRHQADRDLFFSLIDFENDCWIWFGPTQHGYGAFRGYYRAHRVLLELLMGRALRPGEFGLHACDNRPCVRVNAEHVHAGTQQENMQDMVAKGRDYRGEMTPERRLKLREARLGKGTPLATRARMSAAHKGIVFTLEHRANLSAARRRPE